MAAVDDVAVVAEVPGRWPAGSPTKPAGPWPAHAMLEVSPSDVDWSARRGCRRSVLCSGMRVRTATLMILAGKETSSEGVLPTYERNSSSICCPHHHSAADADLQKTHFAGKSRQIRSRISREEKRLASQSPYITLQLRFKFQLYRPIELQHWCRCCCGS